MEDEYYECEHFKDLDFTGQTIENCKFLECVFENCIFEECVLLSCTLSECKFQNCRFRNAEIKYSSMNYGEFEECSIFGMNWDVLSAHSKFSAPIRKLEGCALKYNNFVEMDLKGLDFSGNTITDSMFAKCALEDCKFKNSVLSATEFHQCDLRKADFREAFGYQIDITSNRMKNARFSYPEVVHLLDVLEIKID